MRRHRSLVLAPLLAVALLGSACGGDGDEGSGGPPPAPDAAESDARTQERAFLAAMVPHHRSAVEMAEAAEGRLENEEIRDLQAAIAETQRAEVSEMERIHQRLFGVPLRPDEGAHVHLGLSAEQAGMGHMMSGDPIRGASPPVDRAFIDHMVPHHQGAVRMAEAVLEKTGDRELRELAEEIVRAQREEIRTMNEVREQEHGGPVPEGTEMAPAHGGH